MPVPCVLLLPSTREVTENHDCSKPRSRPGLARISFSTAIATAEFLNQPIAVTAITFAPRLIPWPSAVPDGSRQAFVRGLYNVHSRVPSRSSGSIFFWSIFFWPIFSVPAWLAPFLLPAADARRSRCGLARPGDQRASQCDRSIGRTWRMQCVIARQPSSG